MARTINLTYGVLAPSLITLAMVALGGVGVASEPSCLIFARIMSGTEATLQGTLTNHCEKAVTAYTLSVQIEYGDGSTITEQGIGEDLLLGSSASPVLGIGPIQSEEQRTTAQWGLTAKPTTVITKVTTTISSIIFDDASASGDDQSIDRMFTERDYDLREWRFWRDLLISHQDELMRKGRLSRLMELADLPGREKAAHVARRPQLIEAHRQIIRKALESLDSSVASGRLSYAQAVEGMRQHLDSRVDLLERNVRRSK